MRAVAVALLLLPAAAAAAAPVEAEQPTDQAARELYDQAVQRFDARDFPAARQRFEQLYQLTHRKELLYNIAVCYREVGQLASALDYFRRYVASAGPMQQDGERVRLQIADLERLLVARLEVVSPGASGAVTVDGVARGTTPLTLELAPGAHTVRVDLPRGSERRELSLAGGERRLIEIRGPRSRVGLAAGLGVGAALVVAAVVTIAVVLTLPAGSHPGTLSPGVVELP
jgi:hypothetical protein